MKSVLGVIPGLAPVPVRPAITDEQQREQPKAHRPFGLQEAPTVYPSEEEFRDPYTYIKSLIPLGDEYGIVKIEPPAKWRPKFSIDLGVSTTLAMCVT
jgi:histone demethylase JARID1